LNVICSQYDRFMEREKAAAATKTIDAEWKELQMLMSALKVCDIIIIIINFIRS